MGDSDGACDCILGPLLVDLGTSAARFVSYLVYHGSPEGVLIFHVLRKRV